eukprot:Gb_09602 [translate_table: standard]
MLQFGSLRKTKSFGVAIFVGTWSNPLNGYLEHDSFYESLGTCVIALPYFYSYLFPIFSHSSSSPKAYSEGVKCTRDGLKSYKGLLEHVDNSKVKSNPYGNLNKGVGKDFYHRIEQSKHLEGDAGLLYKQWLVPRRSYYTNWHFKASCQTWSCRGEGAKLDFDGSVLNIFESLATINLPPRVWRNDRSFGLIPTGLRFHSPRMHPPMAYGAASWGLGMRGRPGLEPLSR